MKSSLKQYIQTWDASFLKNVQRAVAPIVPLKSLNVNMKITIYSDLNFLKIQYIE
nr:MAG TPA: hypothetical protein [Caudoviricetes sp.]